MLEANTVNRNKKPQISEDNQELLDTLLGITVKELIDVIKSGESTASHLNVARALLKDNFVTVHSLDTQIGDLVGVLPFADPEEDAFKEFSAASK